MCVDLRSIAATLSLSEEIDHTSVARVAVSAYRGGTTEVAAFELDVFSEPHAALSLWGDMTRAQVRKLVEYDSELIKPAILFSTKVYLHSYREDMRLFHQGRIAEREFMPLRMFLHYVEFVRGGDRDEFRRAGLDGDEIITPTEMQHLDKVRHASIETRDFDAFRDVFLEYVGKYSVAITKVVKYEKERLSEWLEPLDSSQLNSAVTAGFLEVSPWNMETAVQKVAFYNQETYFDNSLLHLLSKLANPTRAAMLDPGINKTLDSVVGHESTRELESARSLLGVETQIASAVVGHLPKLTHLTVREVVDLRKSLEQYLPAFRQEMAQLSDEISEDICDPTDAAKEVERRWTRDVDPILAEIRHKVAIESYPRNLLRALSTEKDVIVSTASSVVLAAGSVAAGLATLLPALAAAGYPAIKAANEFLSTRDEVRQNRLYFLHAVRERVERKGVRRRNS
jgi:hypothetical protein